VLEELAERAGLQPREAFDVPFRYAYPEATVARMLLAPAGLATLIGPDRERQVQARLVEALAPYRSSDGTYVLHNEFRHLVAAAPGHD
jgi:hypothetical protein